MRTLILCILVIGLCLRSLAADPAATPNSEATEPKRIEAATVELNDFAIDYHRSTLIFRVGGARVLWIPDGSDAATKAVACSTALSDIRRAKRIRLAYLPYKPTPATPWTDENGLCNLVLELTLFF